LALSIGLVHPTTGGHVPILALFSAAALFGIPRTVIVAARKIRGTFAIIGTGAVIDVAGSARI
jgi:hypothetical protein